MGGLFQDFGLPTCEDPYMSEPYCHRIFIWAINIGLYAPILSTGVSNVVTSKQSTLVQLGPLQPLHLPALRTRAGRRSGNLSSRGTFATLSLADELTLKPSQDQGAGCPRCSTCRRQSGVQPCTGPARAQHRAAAGGSLMRLVPGQANDCSSRLLF